MPFDDGYILELKLLLSILLLRLLGSGIKLEVLIVLFNRLFKNELSLFAL